MTGALLKKKKVACEFPLVDLNTILLVNFCQLEYYNANVNLYT